MTGEVPGQPHLSHQLIWPYTDLLLHDMGEGLADGRPEGEATGSEWRTPPLWGIGLTETVSGHTLFLHDGRARNLTEAILWHGGEGEAARDKFAELPKADRDALARFREFAMKPELGRALFHLSPPGRGRLSASTGDETGEGEPPSVVSRQSPLTSTLSPKGRGGLAAVFAGAVIFFASATLAHAEADHAAIARAALSEVIRPGYAAFARSDRGPERQGRRAVRRALALRLDDGKEGLRRRGRGMEQGRDPALRPDRRATAAMSVSSIGPTQRDSATGRSGTRSPKRDESVTKPDGAFGKSVALQGLPALEYLLYGDGAETLAAAADDGAFRCAFARAVAANIAGIAKSVVEDWREGSPYEKSFLAPGPDDARYRAPKEVTLELFKSFTAGIELVRDQKLGKPLGARPRRRGPSLPRSGGAG